MNFIEIKLKHIFFKQLMIHILIPMYIILFVL